jgi:hypothetical protein
MQNIWVNRPIQKITKKMWCNCSESARQNAPRGADFDPSQCPDLVIRLERTTGFEPGDPNLGKVTGCNSATYTFVKTCSVIAVFD